MKTIMIMFDSLNRHFLPSYGCDWIHAPNFKRLAEKTVVFDSCYAGSLPCMPARRELHTGRYNFLHRSWGPIEPYDESMPEILKRNGVHSHLITDHHHYFEDGGATYHTRYKTWEFVRGQEYDAWKAELKDPDIPGGIVPRIRDKYRQYSVNKKYIPREHDHPQTKTFQLGLDFIRENHQQDNWFLQLEAFDPHEPFFAPERFRRMYPMHPDGEFVPDWPAYGKSGETREQIDRYRYTYASLVSMCDESLGKILDIMDELDLWKDTLLIVNTDHGFLLGEKEWWGKCLQPFFNELVHLPFFIWDPRSGKRAERNGCLVQTIDIAPTILDFFHIQPPESMLGEPLGQTIASGKPVREAALFGIHGGHVNCTDGRYVYMRASANEENSPLYNYTLMPTHLGRFFSLEELQGCQWTEPFTFTKGCRLLKVDIGGKRKTTIGANPYPFGSLLFDLQDDPEQLQPIEDIQLERKMEKLLVGLMRENDAPKEQYERLGIMAD